MVIVIEFLILIYFLFRSKKDIKKIFAIDSRSILWGLMVGTIFSILIFVSKQTDIGSRTINQFVDGINASPIVLYLIYPLVIAFSEEFIFRYIIAKKYGMFFSAILFTILHWRLNFPILLYFPIFLLAISQSFLLGKTKMIVSLIIVHLMVTYSLLLL